MLPPQPLEFSDFSGGITDNYFQADPRRYQRADNFWINVNKKLDERWGTIAYGEDNYYLGNNTPKRITSMFSFINETILMANSSQDIYTPNTANTSWSRIIGMGTNSALQGGDAYSQVSYAEFQRQIYLTSDGSAAQNGILPSKIFRDDTNAWVARTVGFPRAYVTGSYTAGSLLASCITLANALRTSMISHFGDAINPTYVAVTAQQTTPTNLHINIDKYSLSYFVTQTFTGYPETPSPVPTPQAACTNAATLYTLVQALNLAYAHHIADGMVNYNSGGTIYYHQNKLFPNGLGGYDITKGPGVGLTNNALPDSVGEAAAMLDDLLQKWNWHRKAVNTHSPTNDPAQFDIYAPTASKIGTVSLVPTTPTIAPDWSDVINYANNLKYIYNRHVTNNLLGSAVSGYGQHKQADTFDAQLSSATGKKSNFGLQCTLPDATALDDAYLIIYWLRANYYWHALDSFRTADMDRITFTTNNASALVPGPPAIPVGGTIGAVQYYPSGSAYSMNADYIIHVVAGATTNAFGAMGYEFDGNGYYTKALSLSATGLDRNCVQTTTYRAEVSGKVTTSFYHSNLTTWTNTTTTGGYLAAESFTTSPEATGTDLSSWLALANEFFSALATHANNNLVHYNGTLATSPQEWLQAVAGVSNSPFVIPTIASYAYAFFFSDEYTVEPNGLDYLVQGNPLQTAATDCAVSYPLSYQLPDSGIPYYSSPVTQNQMANVLSNLPVLTNTNATNYDTSSLVLNIYRTTDGGSTFYKVADVPNGTTTYSDIINDTVANAGDTALSDRQIMYTSGGVLGYDQPPISKFIHELDGYTYYGAITDTGQYFPGRIVQSVGGAPDAAPATNYVDLNDTLTGLSSTRSNLIAFCTSSVFRISGGFNSLGQGALIQERISDQMGCLNQKSIVKTEIGVFFAGTDGFYYTDGFQLIKASIDLDETYASLTRSAAQKRNIYGAYDKLTRRVWWSLRESATSPENTVSFVLYLDYGVKPSSAFTTISNGLNYRPASMVFRDGVGYIGHGSGAILKFDEDTKWDTEVSMSTSPSTWNRIYIPYDYISAAVDMGTTFARKWLTKMHLVGQNHGNVNLQPYARRDLNQTQAGDKVMAPVAYNQNPIWGTAQYVWGASTPNWEYDGKMDVWRRFPASTLRSDFMQVRLTPSDEVVYSSSVNYPDFCYVTVNGTTKRITILTPSGYSAIVWPTDMVGYRIKLQSDNYVYEYEILDYISTTIIHVDDPDSTLTTFAALPGLKWEVWGIKKEQRVQISSFVLHFAYLGDKNQAYPGAKSNAGLGNGGQNP